MFRKHNNTTADRLFLLGILIFGGFLRLSFIWWDNGFHLHPDERMLIMVAEKISFFTSMNPHFFSYGSLPIYILKALGDLATHILKTPLNTYDGLLPIGRILSTAAEIFTVLGVYLLTYELFGKKKIALYAALLYSIAFFPIQNAHFFIVDVFVNALSVFILLVLLKHYRHPQLKTLLILAVLSAAAVTSKFTSLIFLPIIGLVLLFSKNKHESIIIHVGKLFIFSSCFLLLTFVFMPYMYLDLDRFAQDVFFQLRMNSDAYAFPYTLQYVRTLPYLYHLKNIFMWGLGPILSVLAMCGFVFIVFLFKNKHLKREEKTKIAMFLVWYSVYFVLLGRSAVKFMRYMLPLYPFLLICASYFVFALQKRISHKLSRYFFSGFIILMSVVWTWGFLNIYATENTRHRATKWIHKNIVPGSVIAVEHWDDLLPLTNSLNYRFTELPLYNVPDDTNKWIYVDSLLAQSNYVIVASNRLYTPLMKLDDCTSYTLCYPKTARYYQELFAGNTKFKKVAEFTSYPRWELFGFKIQLRDDSADESFTVYDHPKIMIFKKK